MILMIQDFTCKFLIVLDCAFFDDLSRNLHVFDDV